MFLKSFSNSLHNWSTLAFDLYECVLVVWKTLFDEAWGPIYRGRLFLIIEGKDLQNLVNLGANLGLVGFAAFLRRSPCWSPETLTLRWRTATCPPAVAGRDSSPSVNFRGGPPHSSDRRAPAVAVQLRGGRWSPSDSRFPDYAFLLPFSAQICTFLTKHVKIPKCIEYANNGHVEWFW